MNHNVWIFHPRLDLTFLILPGICTVFLLFVLNGMGLLPTEISPWTWFFTVLLIDVAHVYSTLFRSYFNEEEWKRKKSLLITVPIFCFLSSTVLYSFGSLWFWRIMAYIAVFHFIRQQFGFMALYRKKFPDDKIPFRLDRYTIYLMGGIPILYWHFTDQKREFSWFMNGDFLTYPIPAFAQSLLWFEHVWLVVYLFIHSYFFFRFGILPLGKILLVLNTWAVWFFGIVYYNSDFSFTVTNVVNHGVPYIFLLFYYTLRNRSEIRGKFSDIRSNVFLLFCFLGILFLFAYGEEWIWDSFIWKDHATIFRNSSFYTVEIPDFAASLLVSALFLPQFTHYILDAFLWKVGTPNPKLRNFFRISED
ncbi:hypothetical protein EHQ12_13515 [Leptospira gomenensis]|uniref:Uncharacterized protein n=1 Tax=Leptospira gomenensis TaxID=2484974 RepID=A0A5F1Y5X1_9LEPT|nr:hypothetical protein [Leptospira gomenensis]TGK28065.1 hypothetical protein EHQ17_18450 [Leptospira gomenensis]TGK37079.1 hypothetical protein EHQ12_13515 [Leptospira gomenensis]TGK45715.1 hypothetical protein EHQ07_08525 [Leptospira gomenensis]TGK59654.1 hypothetical protein EHQ13_12735 [Leptospira gomenensis]